MRHGNKDWFEWMYAGFPEEMHVNPNLTLAEAVNTLRRIPFQKASEILLEIQVFFALRTLRCIYLWDQVLSAAEIEVFANEGLREVLTEQEYNFFMGESKNLKQLVLNEKAIADVTNRLLSVPH